MSDDLTTVTPAPSVQSSLRPPASLRWLLWVAYVIAWTWSLERPYPEFVLEHKEFDWYFFLFGKGLHISAYAGFAVLSAWLHAPLPWRWLLLIFMSAHAVGTEYWQQFTPTRYPSLTDVALDHVGIVLGAVLSWKWWLLRR